MPCAAVDLFCGIGGLTRGLEDAGINVVAGIDIEAECQYAYEENNHARFIQKDIVDMPPQEIEKLYPSNTDMRILAGCAPCQPFSKYTKRYRKNGYNDEKWRLLYSFGRLAKHVMPDVITMENVPELEKTNVFSDFLSTLEECGYHVIYTVVYCPDYGVPQSRKRLVLLASLHGDIEIPRKTHEGHYRTVRDANLPVKQMQTTPCTLLLLFQSGIYNVFNNQYLVVHGEIGRKNSNLHVIRNRREEHIPLCMGVCNGICLLRLSQHNFTDTAMDVLDILSRIGLYHLGRAQFFNLFLKITVSLLLLLFPIGAC